MKHSGVRFFLFLVLFLAMTGGGAVHGAYKYWADVAVDIERSLKEAIQMYGEGKKEEAMERVADSYFGLFEAEEANMEIAVRRFISLKEAIRLEKGFNVIRRAMHNGAALAEIRQQSEVQIKHLHEAAHQLDKKGVGLDVSFQQ